MFKRDDKDKKLYPRVPKLNVPNFASPNLKESLNLSIIPKEDSISFDNSDPNKILSFSNETLDDSNLDIYEDTHSDAVVLPSFETTIDQPDIPHYGKCQDVTAHQEADNTTIIHKRSKSLTTNLHIPPPQPTPSAKSPKMSDYQNNIKYKLATSYLNLFRKDNVQAWFDECVALYTDAAVEPKTYLFEIIIQCNSFLPTQDQIQWYPTITEAIARAKVIEKFQVSGQEKLKKISDQEQWKNKSFASQLRDLKDVLGNNYGGIQDILLSRVPDFTRTYAFTKMQSLATDASKNDEEKLTELAQSIDDYHKKFPPSNNFGPSINHVSQVLPNVSNIANQHAFEMHMQQEQMIKSIADRVINSIGSMHLAPRNNKDPSTHAKHDNADAPSNSSSNNNWRARKSSQNNNRQHSGDNNYQRYNSAFNNRSNNARNNNAQYGQNRDRERRPPQFRNLCTEHYKNPDRPNLQLCKAGCKFHYDRVCFGHLKFGDRAWQSHCDTFCRYYGTDSGSYKNAKNDPRVASGGRY